MKDLHPIIAENLALLRKSSGLTQAQLAERLGYSDKAVSRWEKGDALPDINVLYELCGCPYWYELVENLAPHFDRTTMLSFRCRPAEAILDDHTSLLKAIEAKDTAAARTIAARHMQRYTENLATIRKSFPQYFK